VTLPCTNRIQEMFPTRNDQSNSSTRVEEGLGALPFGTHVRLPPAAAAGEQTHPERVETSFAITRSEWQDERIPRHLLGEDNDESYRRSRSECRT